jgi:DUF1365 family protein
VVHRRLDPAREFSHPIAMTYVDLAELPQLLGGRLIRRRPGPVRLRRGDLHGSAELPLQESVRETVRCATGRRPEGPIRLLTSPRSFGFRFNPVSFYYCFDQSADTVQAVLAEVTNTPWGERHAYVIPGGAGCVSKAMRVSPFLEMDQTYAVDAGTPGDHLHVNIHNHRGGHVVFEAALLLERRELSAAALRRMTLRYPAASARMLALIYGHAIGLRLAGLPVLHQEGGSHG